MRARGRNIAVISVVVALIVAACGGGADPAPRPEGVRDVSIDARGGPSSDSLDAIEMGDGPIGVVLAHGASTRKEMWHPLLPELAAADMHAIAFDFAGDRAIDLQSVLNHLVSAGAEQIVLMGSSLGAANVLDFAFRQPVLAVVAFSVGGWNGELDVPALFVASEDDGGAASTARTLASEHEGRAVVVDGSVHGADLLRDHPEVAEEIVAFVGHAAAGAPGFTSD